MVLAKIVLSTVQKLLLEIGDGLAGVALPLYRAALVRLRDVPRSRWLTASRAPQSHRALPPGGRAQPSTHELSCASQQMDHSVMAEKGSRTSFSAVLLDVRFAPDIDRQADIIRGQ